MFVTPTRFLLIQLSYREVIIETLLTLNIIVDIDECLEGTHECSDECENTEGGYQCHCPPGFRLQSNRHRCKGTIIYILQVEHKVLETG